MADPFHLLKHEHRIIEQGLRGINGLCLRLELEERITPEDLSQAVEFISGFADRYHHGKEERLLFPALEGGGLSRHDGPLQALAREHELERQMVEELGRAAQSYRQGDAGSGRYFAEVMRRYTDHLIGHVQREDNILFRLADEVLDDEAKQRLAEEFVKMEREAGVGALETYKRLAAQLEEKWSV